MNVLETERLQLRTWLREDAESLFPICSDPQVMRTMVGEQAVASISDVEARIDAHICQQDEYGFCRWAVIEKDSQQLVGECGLQPLERGSDIAISYLFATGVWGKGYPPEAAAACVEWGLHERGLSAIIGVAKAANRASCWVLEQIGLRYVGPSRYFDQPVELFRVENDPSPSTQQSP